MIKTPEKPQTPLKQQNSPRLKIRNTSLFHSTNGDWNVLKLNLSWVIGSLSTLFRNSKAKYPDYWERYYYRSGEERRRHLVILSEDKRKILEDFTLPYTNPSLYRKLTNEEKTLNTEYGRTNEDLRKIADYFYQHLRSKPAFATLTPLLCQEYVFIRVIDETFIGFQREITTLSYLKHRFPTLAFKSVSSEMDTRYAIDSEVYHKNKLLFALQIKSSKYLNSQMKIMKEVTSMNDRKNRQYQNEFNVPIHYVFVNGKGHIANREILNEINSYLS